MSDVSFMAEDEYLDNDYFYSPDYDSEKEDEKADKKIRILKIVFVVFCLLLVVEFCIFKFVKPSLASPKVTVSGHSTYSAEEIGKLLLPLESTNWFDFDVRKAVQILCAEPGIETVVVEKQYPDKIYVQVTERQPVALTFVEMDGKTRPVQIDKNGVVFYDDKQSYLKSNNLPIVSGIPMEHMANGKRIPKMYRPLMDQIAKISENHSEYFAGISEICVLPNDFENYELALIPAQSKVRFITDRALNEDALKDMMVVLDVVNWLGKDVAEVDLRYNSVSYKGRK